MKKFISYINLFTDICDSNESNKAVETIYNRYKTEKDKDKFVLALARFAVEQRKYTRMYAKVTTPPFYITRGADAPHKSKGDK